MRVLVTGASGMLGRAVAELLVSRGDEVTVLQRRAAEVDCAQVRADICDADAVAAALVGQEGVIHLAAKVNVVGDRHEFERINVGATRSLLSASRARGVGRFVYVSSPSVAHAGSALFGATAQPADPASTRGHYSRTKAIAERLALSSDDGPFAVTAIRPHLVWGPGDTQLVGRIVDRARAGRLATVGSGAALIDTTYVDNAADALVAALDRCEQARGRAFVVSNGQPRPVAEIVGRLCAAAGVAPPRFSVPFRLAWLAGAAVEALSRSSEPPMTRFLAEQLATAHWFDQRAVRETLHWSPRVSLDEGFARLTALFAAQ